MIKNRKNYQFGSVSIFTVVFATLLILIVTISFIGIMMQDQEQATSADLSQSAYDSAQAGVEDAKRALLLYKNICKNGNSSDCLAAKMAIDSGLNPNLKCNEAINTLNDTAGPYTEAEVKIQTDGSDDLNQAYTCVKINVDTPDYLGSLATNEYKLIPLLGSEEIDSIKIDWFSYENIGSTSNYDIDLLNIGSPLLAQNDWPLNRPSIMQTQLIQYGDSFKLSDFDGFISSQSNSNTLFLYPVSNIGLSSYNFLSLDTRKTGIKSPISVHCKDSLIDGGYACSVDISLPLPIGSGNRTAYLFIGSIYNNADYRVTMYNKSGKIVSFSGVQPEVDSTGRASDLFRRVKTRVELVDSEFPYPIAAVNTSGNLCKNFLITNNQDDYKNFCTP